MQNGVDDLRESKGDTCSHKINKKHSLMLILFLGVLVPLSKSKFTTRQRIVSTFNSFDTP
jgi:hypothetical protein